MVGYLGGPDMRSAPYLTGPGQNGPLTNYNIYDRFAWQQDVPNWIDSSGYYPQQQGGYYPPQPYGGGGVGAYRGGFNALGYPNQGGSYFSPFAFGGGCGSPTNTQLFTGASTAIDKLWSEHYGQPYLGGPYTNGGGIGGGWNGWG
jgi:hypothetical protein